MKTATHLTIALVLLSFAQISLSETIEPDEYLPSLQIGFEKTIRKNVLRIERTDVSGDSAEKTYRFRRIELDWHGRIYKELDWRGNEKNLETTLLNDAPVQFYTYSSVRGPLSEVAIREESEVTSKMIFIYDTAGDLIQIALVKNSETTILREFFHSSDNKMIKAASPENPRETYFYEFVDNRCTRQINHEDGEVSSALVTYQYNDNGFLMRTEVYDLGYNHELQEFYTYEYTFDTRGNWTSRTRYKWTNADSDWVEEVDLVSTRRISYRR
ncbi:MAG: DUF3836 domain-containing protein [Pyrinomonadaceae bacterium]